MHGQPELIRPEVAEIQVVIAFEVAYLHALVLEPRDLVNDLPVLIDEESMIGDPQVKDITKQIQMGGNSI